MVISWAEKPQEYLDLFIEPRRGLTRELLYHAKNTHAQKQPRQDVEVRAGEGFFRGQVSPDGVGRERGQGLVGAEEEFVRGSAEER